MAARIKVEIQQKHHPLIVTTPRGRMVLRETGDLCMVYVNEISELHIREMTADEMRADHENDGRRFDCVPESVH